MADLLRITYTEREPVNYAPDKLVEKEIIISLSHVNYIDTKTNTMYTDYGESYNLTQDTMNRINALTIGIY